MRRFLLLLALTLFCVAGFVQCHKCSSKKLDDQVFTPQELAIVPYNNAGEKFVFKDSLNDSMIYTTTERFFYRVGPITEYSDNESNCLGDYCYKEQSIGGLENNDHSGEIEFILDFDKDDQTLTFKKAINLRIDYTAEQYMGFDGYYYFDDQKLIQNDPIIAFSNSLQIGPKTFNSVYTLFNNNSRIETVYYNFSRGIVGFKTNDGLMWYLAN